MPRLRTIKPGFFTNDRLATLPPLTRLLFAGLWCLADREGRLEDRPARIKAELLPYDTCDVDAMLDTLASGADPFVLRYVAQGTRYLQITKFGVHQHPHYKEVPSVIPAPPDHHDRAMITPTSPLSISNVGSTSAHVRPDVDPTLTHDQPNVGSTSVHTSPASRVGSRTYGTFGALGNPLGPLVPSSSPQGAARGRARAPDADAPAFPLASSDDETTTKRTRQASWQTHLLAAFDALDLPAPQLDGAEGRAARRLVTQHGAGDVAACWAAIASGRYGDAFDQGQLSFSHLAAKNRLSNWLAQRNGTYRPPHATTATLPPGVQPQSQQRQPLPPDLPDVGELKPVSAADFAKFAREARRRQSSPEPPEPPA